jgi:enterochelin esterase-like enzyme
VTRHRIALAALALLLSIPVEAGLQEGGFDRFLATYRAAEPAARPAFAAEWVAHRQTSGGLPIVGRDGNVLFVYLGSGGEDDVRLVGDFRPRSFHDPYWDETGLVMEEAAPGGGLYFVRLEVEPEARLDYAFAVDGERRADPLNPRTLFSGTGGGEVSELVMPGYRFDPAARHEEAVPSGSLHPLAEPWADPAVTVYLPPGFDRGRRYPVVYTADGSAWNEHFGLPATLDALIASGRIEPLIAVMIDSAADRRRWYYYEPALLVYLDRVVRWIDERYPTRAEPASRLHAGTSAGGRASVYAALERPDLFAKAAALSPALQGPLSYWRPWIAGERRPPAGVELWLSAGTYEGVIAAEVEAAAELFRGWGLPVATVTTREGHSFGAWRNLVPRMLEHFFPPASAGL